MNSADQLAAILLEDEGSWDFTSKIDSKRISVSGEHESWYLQKAECQVDWHLDMDVRSWGLKEANPIIQKIKVALTFDVYDKDSGKDTYEVVELEYPPVDSGVGASAKALSLRAATQVGAEVEWSERDFDNAAGISVFPHEVEVDLRTNNITVFF